MSTKAQSRWTLAVVAGLLALTACSTPALAPATDPPGTYTPPANGGCADQARGVTALFCVVQQ
jgi:hypothetical protein